MMIGLYKQPRLVQPVRARHLPAAVEGEEAGVAGGVEPGLAGEDGGDAGVDLMVQDFACCVQGLWFPDGLCRHEHAGDVGQGVLGARGVVAKVEFGQGGADAAARGRHLRWREW